ncbi:DNA cytosine methyltransferase [Flagellatimonas centrodinii]|uniref:DNA cytosine methyltransferase n=1 Tax=Flagellatimonas centrodinii TaxID=2806210 RepID=UPI00344E7EB4
MCAGAGGGARGFNRGRARVGNMTAIYRCIGGIDVDPAGIRDFERLSGVAGTLMDLFDREQYTAFHGRPPPDGWREATADDVRRAYNYERPHVVFISAPCKGFSGLLSQLKSLTDKYQALNRLTLRAVWLMLEAWADDPPELILFENVPRIATRGRALLDHIQVLLRSYGYAVAETTHDCGEIGGLAQSRKRFLLVARHAEKVPPFLYEPERRPLRAVGDVLSRLPLPVGEPVNPMHRLPALQWKTWVRLAFVEAGSDWRSLNRLAVEDGKLRDYLIVPGYHAGYMGVQKWDDSMGTVAGRSTPTNGAFSVADPRHPAGADQYHQYGVTPWDETSATITSQKSPGQGRFSVADPRHAGPAKHNNEFRIVRWNREAGAVTSAHGTGQCVADPRPPREDLFGKYAITRFDEAAGTVIGGSTTGQGAFAVSDPRPGMARGKGSHYLTGGHYGVVPWQGTAYAVTGSGQHDNGHNNVADPRMPEPADKLQCRIIAEDGTWHRPFTTLELAALQSLLDLDEYEAFQLDGNSDSAWRERIGNAVPSAAAEAIANVMARTLLLAWSGETFILSSEPIWVRPIVAAVQCGSVA